MLDLPVSVLAPPGAGEEEGAAYTVAYGCALQAAGAAGVSLNLTPARMVVAREAEQRRQSRYSGWTLAAAVVLAAGMVFGAAVQSKRQALAVVDSQLRELRVDIEPPPMPPVAIKETAAAVTGALESRVTAAKSISLLSRQLPAGAWLTELLYNSNTGCVIRGYTTAPQGAQAAQIALLKQQVFDEVTLDYRAQETIGEVPVWAFQITCRLQPKEQARRGSRR